MRVNRVDEVIHSSFQRDCRNSLGYHFRHRISNHVDAEDLTVCFVGNNLNETVGRILDLRLGHLRKWKFAYFYLVTSLPGFGLRQTDARDLWITIRAGRNLIVFEGSGVFSCDLLNRNDAFLHCDVSEQRRWRHVAYRVDAFHVRLHVLADFDKASLRGDAELFEADIGCVRTATSCQQQLVDSVLLDLAFLGLKRDLQAILDGFGTFELCLGVNLNSLFSKDPLKLLRDLLVLEGHDIRQDLEQCYLRAKTVVDGRKLHADGTAPDDQHRLRNLGQVKDADIAENGLFIKVVPWQRLRFRTCSNDDVFGDDFCRCTVSLHQNLIRRDDRTVAFEHCGFVFS